MRSIIFAALAIATAASTATPVWAQYTHHAKAGTLACDISAGMGLIITSNKIIACMFTPSQPGTREVYTGSITKFSLDPGAGTGSEMIWAVYVPSTKHFGALSGHFGGAPAEGKGRVGAGANILIGGSNRTVTLQPASVEGPAGLNIAAGVAELDLRPAR